MKYLSNRIEIAAIILSAFFTFSPVAAHAEDDAQTYTPTSAWLVGPASLDKDSASVTNNKMPCVVANQYNNGFVVRFSGGDDSLMAMAIDFRQRVFTPRQKYDVEVSVPGKFFQVLSGAAYDEGTLLFSLYKFPDFYKILQSAEVISLKAEGTTVSLRLTGLSDGFRRMNSCYDPEKITNNQVAADKSSSTIIKDKAPQNPLLSTPAKSALTPMPGDGDMPALPTPPVPSAVQKPDPEASVNAVLKNGGPVSPAGGSASQLMAKAQEAQKTAEQLSANNPMKPDQGVPMSGSWAKPNQPKDVRPNGSDIMVQATQSGGENQIRRWRAVKGGDLHDVLSSWTAGASVKLMWLAQQDFAVPRSMVLSGTFQEATKQLLEEFADQNVRPVGRIYREPGTTQLILVIEQAAAPLAQ